MTRLIMTACVALSLFSLNALADPTTQPATTQPASPKPLATDGPYTQQQIVDLLAHSYGFDQWDRVEAVRWTFAGFRSWEWSPKTNAVKLIRTNPQGKQSVIEYDRDDLNDDTPKNIRRADKNFINDSFWFLLPLHLQWSEDVVIEDGSTKLAPLGRVIAREIVITYPSQGGGYTPGDVYKLYVDDAWRIHQWTFHKAGRAEPNLKRIWCPGDATRPDRLLRRVLRRQEGQAADHTHGS